MQNPVYPLKCIIDNAIDLYRKIETDGPEITPEDIMKIGEDTKRHIESLVDMAWYKVDSKDWNEKHPGNIGTKL